MKGFGGSGSRDEDAKDDAYREPESVLVVRVEMWPKGDRNRAREIATAIIVNDGNGSPSVGSYDVALLKGNTGGLRPAAPNDVWRVGRVEGFPRLRLGVWDLLLRALASIVGKRNEEAQKEFALASQDIGRQAEERFVTAEGITKLPAEMVRELGIGSQGGHVWFLRGEKWEAWLESELEAQFKDDEER